MAKSASKQVYYINGIFEKNRELEEANGRGVNLNVEIISLLFVMLFVFHRWIAFSGNVRTDRKGLTQSLMK